ncbi:MAG: hypothetical protein KBC90_11920 [Spirochaetes bacterium]|nr:hypothetical protein [Spirochaetota bacterium]
MFLVGMLALPVISQAAGISLGVATWYSMWDPYWGKYKAGLQLPIMPMSSFTPPDNMFKVDVKPNFMYGPVLSARLPDNVNLITRFMYGQFNAQKKEQYYLNYLVMDNIGLITRYDADLMLRYQFHDMVYLKTGFKYVHFKYEVLGLSLSYIGFFAAGRIEKENTYNEYAPFAGFGVMIPAVKDMLFIEIDSVFQFCFADESNKQFTIGRTEFSSDITYIPPYTKRKNVKKLGVEANCNLIYRLPVIPMSMSLGFKYNMYKKLVVEKDKALEYEHQYGATASVEYYFDISKSKAGNAASLKPE